VRSRLRLAEQPNVRLVLKTPVARVSGDLAQNAEVGQSGNDAVGTRERRSDQRLYLRDRHDRPIEEGLENLVSVARCAAELLGDRAPGAARVARGCAGRCRWPRRSPRRRRQEKWRTAPAIFNGAFNMEPTPVHIHSTERLLRQRAGVMELSRPGEGMKNQPSRTRTVVSSERSPVSLPPTPRRPGLDRATVTTEREREQDDSPRSTGVAEPGRRGETTTQSPATTIGDIECW
jgi:hypothetical protein